MKEKKDYSRTLIIKINKDGYQYDINTICKSFYPELDVRVLVTDDDGHVIESVHDDDILAVRAFFTVVFSDNNCEVTGEAVNGKISKSFDLNKDLKKEFMSFLYDFLSEKTKKTLPWGTLTGIRPTKIAMTMFENGADDGIVRDWFENEHKVSKEKTNLAIDIAKREGNLLSKLNLKDGYSLYIGIPFCPTTCLYCSFTSYPIKAWEKRVDEYLDALAKELEYVKAEHCSVRMPDTIYIGGGTPTSLDEYHFEKLLDKITSTIDTSACLEFSCEAGRPDSITPEKLRIMKKYGVDRISVNPQTMQQKTLDLIGRRVQVSQVIQSFKDAREAGHENINMDIILGLPGENDKDVEDTLNQIKNLGPDSLTVHSLAIKRASALKRKLDEIGIDALKITDDTMSLTEQAAKSLGMNPYYMYRQKNMSGNFENVGYSKPGKEGLYNILIMEEVQTIIALGAGSVTKRVYPEGRIERCENHKDVELYISNINDLINRKRNLFSDN